MCLRSAICATQTPSDSASFKHDGSPQFACTACQVDALHVTYAHIYNVMSLSTVHQHTAWTFETKPTVTLLAAYRKAASNSHHELKPSSNTQQPPAANLICGNPGPYACHTLWHTHKCCKGRWGSSSRPPPPTAPPPGILSTATHKTGGTQPACLPVTHLWGPTPLTHTQTHTSLAPVTNQLHSTNNSHDTKPETQQETGHRIQPFNSFPERGGGR